MHSFKYKWTFRNKLSKTEDTPELLGIALFYLCPLLHKLYVTLHQVEA